MRDWTQCTGDPLTFSIHTACRHAHAPPADVLVGARGKVRLTHRAEPDRLLSSASRASARLIQKVYTVVRSLKILLTCSVALATNALANPAADLVIRHGQIWRGAELPDVTAMAILGERIVAVGDDRAVAAWIGQATTVIDAGGHRIIPGFNDAHVHFSDGGSSLAAVQLNDATSTQEIVRRLAAQVKKMKPGQWILAGEWDESKWPGAALPTRQLIDAVTPNNPVAIDRYDGHALLANTLALSLAHIDRNTADPNGGLIVRDGAGEPTGVLKDAAENLVHAVIPAPSRTERRANIERALAHAASLGVTSVQDMGPVHDDLAVYADLRRERKLTVRIYVASPIDTVEDQAKLGIGHAFGDASLRIGALKAFADGSLGSRTAYLFDDFSDEPGNHGLLADTMHPIERTRAYFDRADATALQICTHAIGDRGISTILDLYAEVVQKHGASDRRFRIEHAQHIAAKDFDRFHELGVIASMQPTHAIDDGRWAEPLIGHDRASRTYAFRTLLNHGVHLAFGTDWPVAPLDPLLSTYAAVTRRTLDGRNPNGWFPEQKLTVAETLSTYTAGSAYAEFQEQDKGTLEAGKLADFVMFDKDPLQVDPNTLRDIRVLGTWVGGRRVYTASRP